MIEALTVYGLPVVGAVATYTYGRYKGKKVANRRMEQRALKEMEEKMKQQGETRREETPEGGEPQHPDGRGRGFQ